MLLTVKQQVKHLSKEEYNILKELCHIAKNLVNESLYNIRQHFFKTKKYLNYNENYHLLKTSDNYRTLNSNMSQQIMRKVDGSFKSFFALLKLAQQGKYSSKDCKIPHYLPKDGYTTLVINMVKINNGKFVLPYSNKYKKKHKRIKFNVPKVLADKTVKEIHIIPKANARFFEIHYVYEANVTQRNLNKNNALAIDLGINNLATAVTTEGKTFIIDGRKLKSINQWYNKRNAKLQSIKDKQKLGHKITNQQVAIVKKRNNQINDYMNKTARYIINYCISNDIGTLVVGYNNSFQRNSNLGKGNNQTFVNIPFGQLLFKLKYLCELNNIVFVEQEESYTSKASFWDNDNIPVYSKTNTTNYKFSGKRIFRGLYKTSNGTILNADVNGALNILKKSKVVSLKALYHKGKVDVPIRIRVA